jgi:hypothetical protein
MLDCSVDCQRIVEVENACTVYCNDKSCCIDDASDIPFTILTTPCSIKLFAPLHQPPSSHQLSTLLEHSACQQSSVAVSSVPRSPFAKPPPPSPEPPNTLTHIDLNMTSLPMLNPPLCVCVRHIFRSRLRPFC